MAIVESFFHHTYDTDVESNCIIYTIPTYNKKDTNYTYTASVVTFVDNLCSLINQTEISYTRESDNCINIFGVKYYFDGNYNNVYMRTEYHSFNSSINISNSSDVYPNSCFYKLRVVTNGESYFIIEHVPSGSLANGNDTNSYTSFLYVMKCNFYDDSEAILTLRHMSYHISGSNTLDGFLVDPNAEDYHVSLYTDFANVNNYGNNYYFKYPPFNYYNYHNISTNQVNTYNLAHSTFPTKYNTTDKVLLQPLTLWNNYAYAKDVYIYPATTYSYTNMIVNFNNEEYYIPSCTGKNNIVPICFKL